MRQRVFVAGVLLALLATALIGTKAVYSQADSPGGPPASSFLNVQLRPQLTNMWCWAASGEMVMQYLGHDVSQCVQANNRFGKSDCCNAPTPGECVLGGWPEFEKYGFTYSTTSGAALSWAQVQDQLGNKKTPFAFSWHWLGGGGHMMAAIGYKTLNGTNYVEVNNPWPPNQGDAYFHTYDDYVSGSDHTHWNDYYNVVKK